MKNIFLSLIFVVTIGLSFSIASVSNSLNTANTNRNIPDWGNAVKEISVKSSTKNIVAISTDSSRYEENGWRIRYIVNSSTCANLQLRFSPLGYSFFSSTFGVVLTSDTVILRNLGDSFTYYGQAPIWGVWSVGCPDGTGATGFEGYWKP